ncbi:MAG: redox-regulated ATPase YchF [Candidatus Melainabacteria bacterium RIFOXYA12_FULL_32_12]|nr:MAG: redox-regulated ATPase YchF [Candidatus Melainabacteria bacterium RIFOXYA2_FULL_32_9]OGI29227.1 MAG: redox-regulated ATPase YchF [Candidatus Melainabacteria bacterium RIFOXYA12_FULL_32_12]
MLRAGIVGLPNVGKSTLFNALTSSKNAESANYPFCTIEPNVGVVSVPDERLWILKDIAKTNVVIPTAIEFVDIAGLVKGASKGEGLGNQFLGHIREVDAIIHVVRSFLDENTVHVAGKIDPINDIETINMELALADLNTVEKRKDRISKQVKSREKNAIIEDSVIDKLIELLSEGKPFSIDLFNEEELPFVKNLHLLSCKPVIYAANVSEADLVKGTNEFVEMVKEYAKTHQAQVVVISAQIESELAELSPEEAKDFMEELGVDDSGINRMIKAVYELLGLRTYFTVGEKEVRAWTIIAGTKAPQAAGVIHTDFEKGFIRAEITGYNDFVNAGSYVVAKERGVTRLEGKEYIVQDGDIVHFRFAV